MGMSEINEKLAELREGMARAAAILDSIDKALPEADLRLDFPGGFAILRRGSGDFHSYITDEDDKSVVGGVTRCELTAYHE